MSRKFIFIDESGDPGFPGRSEYFTINVLITNEKGLEEIESTVSSYRFFMGHTKELKRYIHSKNKIIKALLEKISFFSHSSFYTLSVQKDIYEDTYKNKPLIFRNYILKKTLKEIFLSPVYKNSKDIFEVIIDRYLDKEEDRSNLKNYLQRDNQLPHFLDVTQIDSRCSNALQVLDIMSYVQRKKKENFFLVQELNFPS